VAQLQKTCLPGDYDLIVKTAIEKKHQGEHESFTKFLVDMEKKFQRLSIPMVERENKFLMKNRLNK
jgi:hypothetical protein